MAEQAEPAAAAAEPFTAVVTYDIAEGSAEAFATTYQAVFDYFSNADGVNVYNMAVDAENNVGHGLVVWASPDHFSAATSAPEFGAAVGPLRDLLTTFPPSVKRLPVTFSMEPRPAPGDDRVAAVIEYTTKEGEAEAFAAAYEQLFAYFTSSDDTQSYNMALDAENNKAHAFCIYSSRDAFDALTGADGFTAARDAVKPHLAGPPNLKILPASFSKGA